MATSSWFRKAVVVSILRSPSDGMSRLEDEPGLGRYRLNVDWTRQGLEAPQRSESGLWREAEKEREGSWSFAAWSGNAKGVQPPREGMGLASKTRGMQITATSPLFNLGIKHGYTGMFPIIYRRATTSQLPAQQLRLVSSSSSIFSGHNRWSKIHRGKAVEDGKKSLRFSKAVNVGNMFKLFNLKAKKSRT